MFKESLHKTLAVVGGLGVAAMSMATLLGQLLSGERIERGQIVGALVLLIATVTGLAAAASARITDRRRMVELLGATLIILLAIGLLSIAGFGVRLLPFLLLLGWSWVIARKHGSAPRSESSRS